MNPVRNLGHADPKDPDRKNFLAPDDPTSWVILCGAAVIVAIVVGTAFVVGSFRERAIERSKLELQDISRLLAHHFDRQLDEICAAENFLAAYIERRDLSPDEFVKFSSTENVHTMLEDIVVAYADRPSRISLFDQDGTPIAFSGSTSAPPSSISGRSYFKAIKEQGLGTSATIQIALVDGGIPSDKRIVLARGISASDGRLLGVVARDVPLADLARFLSSVAHNGRTIQLVNDHARAVVLYAGASIADERQLVVPPILDQTNKQHIVSTERLARYPVTVVVATTMADALSNWHDETRTLILVAGLMAAVTGIMLISIVRQLKEQARRLDVAVNNMPQALMLFDPSERLIVKNDRYMEMLGYSEHVRIGCKFKDIVRACQDGSDGFRQLDAYCDSVREALRQESRTQETVEMSDGRSLQFVNQALSGGGWISTIEDITERRKTEELMIRLAQYDPLTGLPNRASFLERLSHKLSNSNHGFAVLFLDLDEFKTVNDTLGHHIGDQLLTSVALALKSNLDPCEFVARLGGDEFALVSGPIPGRDGVLELIQRIYDAIRRPHRCGGHSLTIDASIGITLAPYDATTCEYILRSADLAMHAAKAQGKKTYKFFEPDMEESARERVLLEAELRKALMEDQIETYFQPIYDFHGRRIVACEALARWRHPIRGFVSPITFIPIAERAGLIGQLGDIVLRQACQEATSWPGDVAVAVNVSPLQLRSPLFSLKVISALYDSRLPANRLEIEITEAVLIDDDEAALKILHELRAIGVKIALDDFGTGYSSLSYLQRFPFDKIKIDRCFVQGLMERDISRGIVKAVITMASELGMITTAEGAESDSQLEILQNLGCDQVQGNLIAPAGPSARIFALLDSPMPYKARPG